MSDHLPSGQYFIEEHRLTDEMSILSRYVQSRSEDAFRQIVERYINIVYAAARRQTGDLHLAEDVTQAVFAILARKAGAVPVNRPLSAWLLKTTSHCAANARRARDRRRVYESRAAQMQSPSSDNENSWESVAPFLDQGLERLRSADREVLLWRYFEGRSVGQIALALNISEDAASKRIGRAIDQLREFFHRKGVTVSAAAMGTILFSKTSEAAPAGLAQAVSSGAIGKAAAGGVSTAKGVFIMAATTKFKIAAAALVGLLLLTGGGIVAIQHGSGQLTTSLPTPRVPPATAQATVPPTGHTVVFPDGTTFQVLGMQDEPSADGRWWGVDGLEVPAPHYRSSDLSVSGVASRNLRIVAVMVATSMPDKSVRLDVGKSMSWAGSDTVQGNRFTMVQVVSVMNTSDTTTFRVGLADGPWTDQVIYDVATSKPAGLARSPVSVGSITEKDGKTIVRTFDSRWTGSDDQESVVVMAGDTIIWSGQMTKALLSGTAREFNCTKDQIRQAIFRHRPYEWVEMKNVSLRPTTMPTNVQITAESSATSKPAGT